MAAAGAAAAWAGADAAAGFGGGGVHGYSALEGTFLGGCIFSGRAAGRAAAPCHRKRLRAAYGGDAGVLVPDEWVGGCDCGVGHPDVRCARSGLAEFVVRSQSCGLALPRFGPD